MGCELSGRGIPLARPGLRLVVLVAFASILATACMRMDLDLVVHDADEASVDGRLTVSPALLGLMGGVEEIEASFREGLSPAVDASIESVRDGDGWEGIAYEARGPHRAVMGSDLEGAIIEETDTGWRFSWEGEPFQDVPPGEGFRFRFSVSLPGGLERSNSDDTKMGGGMTTARWEIDDPLESVDFLLVTDTSIPADSGGLGAGAIVGIVMGAIVAAALAVFWVSSRRSGRPGPRSGRVRSPAAAPEALSRTEQEALQVLQSNDPHRAAGASESKSAGSRMDILGALGSRAGGLTVQLSLGGRKWAMSGKRFGATLAVCAVVLAVVLVFVVRACSGGDRGASDTVLLIRESSGDLYVADVGTEVDSDDRVARDTDELGYIRTISGGESTWTKIAFVGNRALVVARAGNGHSLWAVTDDGNEQIIDSDDGAISAVVVDETAFVHEAEDASQRCYRGSLEDLERVYRGGYCEITGSGHVLGIDASDEVYKVRLQSPQGDEILRGAFSSRPRIADNGLFLVAAGQRALTVTSVESGDRVWELEGGTGYDMASHHGGYLALAAEASVGEVELILIDAGGNAQSLTELASGSLVAEFAESGSLFWIEHEPDRNDVLSAWDSSRDEIVKLAEEKELHLLGVYGDSAVTVTQDDFGMLLHQFTLEGDSRELHEVDDNSMLQATYIEGDYLYIASGEMVSVVPLNGGEPVDSETWDSVTLLDFYRGSLVAAGVDRSSTVLFQISTGSDAYVEYGEFDEVRSAQLYGDTLYASIVEGSGMDTVLFDASSGERLESDISYDGYRVINSRPITVRRTLNSDDTRLSIPEADAQEFAGTNYASDDGERQLSIGDSWSDSISSSGEVDSYIIRVTDSSSAFSDGEATVVVETHGATDTYIEIYQLDDSHRGFLHEFDDDSGNGYNARVEAQVVPGNYRVDVTGALGSIGDYEVYVGLL